jgi:hypothetical protein
MRKRRALAEVGGRTGRAGGLASPLGAQCRIQRDPPGPGNETRGGAAGDTKLRAA